MSWDRAFCVWTMGQHHHLYNSRQWQRLRDQQLSEDPLCWYCEQIGKVAVANTVDHITPHNGDEALFFDHNNLRSSCKRCHDSIAAVKDRVGYAPGVGLNGMPVDAGHPFYSGGKGGGKSLESTAPRPTATHNTHNRTKTSGGQNNGT